MEPVQPAQYLAEPSDAHMAAVAGVALHAASDDDRSDAGSSTSSGMMSDAAGSRTGSFAPSAGARGSVRSRHTRASMYSKAPTNYDDAEMTTSMFEWNGGGRNVFLTGSWDNYSEKIPMESVTAGHFRTTVQVPNERLEFKFIVDGREKFNPDYPTGHNDDGERVNVKNADPEAKRKAGAMRKLVSKISGLDMYSPFHIQETISMIMFRIFYVLTFPAAAYYFYWLIARGGNRDAYFSWITFVVSEALSFVSAVIGLFGMWKPVKRQWRSLDSLKPALPESDWPTVDILIAHFKEPAEQLRNTVRAALRLDYPSHLIRIIIADDGYFPSAKSLERSQLGLDMYQLLAEEAGYDPMLEEVMNDQGLVEHYKVTAEGEVEREDCAKETHVIDFGPFGEDMYAPQALPRLTLVARVKPEDHHNKAGNINNVLFNAGTDGKIILFLDADMRPTENFLLRTIPLILEEMRDDAVENTMMLDDDPEIGRHANSAWRVNRDVAFVQAPQRFHNCNEADEMAHRNAIFYDGICRGRDGFGLTPFVGTNAIWRREVLSEIGGFVYGSVTEDTLTSNEVHRRGFISKYAAEDLCFGEAPVSVAAAMLQRQRWAKGAVMNGMKIFKRAAEEKKNAMVARRRGEIDEFYEYRRHGRRPNNYVVRGMFWLDSTLYPFLGLSAWGYVAIAVAYCFTGQAPISPKGLAAIAGAFVTYYAIRYAAFYSAFYDVSSVDILRSQETWFSYNICHALGMYQALNQGSKLSWVANTGQRARRTWMEWVNIAIVALLAFSLTYRVIYFLTKGQGFEPWQTVGAMLFASYILLHLWPMVSISLNERYSSTKAKDDEMPRPLAVPTPLIYSSLTILMVVVLSTWEKTHGGQLSSYGGEI
jgi:cellulose synthase/poly-beta-1,6-N-acetylglucosamine synthase-like glycosyltransferase